MHLSAAPFGLEAFMMRGKFQPKLSAVLHFTKCSCLLTGVFPGLLGIKHVSFHFSSEQMPVWALPHDELCAALFIL